MELRPAWKRTEFHSTQSVDVRRRNRTMEACMYQTLPPDWNVDHSKDFLQRRGFTSSTFHFIRNVDLHRPFARPKDNTREKQVALWTDGIYTKCILGIWWNYHNIHVGGEKKTFWPELLPVVPHTHQVVTYYWTKGQMLSWQVICLESLFNVLQRHTTRGHVRLTILFFGSNSLTLNFLFFSMEK